MRKKQLIGQRFMEMSKDVVKEEVISEGEDEEGAGNKRRLIERNRMRAKRARIKRILAGEDVEGVGEEEKRRIKEQVERQKARDKLKRQERNAKLKEEQNEKREETEEQKERRNEKMRFRRLMMTDEEREEKRRKQYFWEQARKSKEEREERRRKDYFWRQARLASMTKEEREERRRRTNERHREWLKSLDEGKRRKHFEGVRRNIKRYTEKLKERDPEGLRERYRENQRRRWRRLGEEGKRRQCKYDNDKRRELWERKEGEEKRRRLNQMKMYQMKRRLRRELEGMGEEKEEIERRVEEMDKRLREELGIGPPRPRGYIGMKGGGDKEATSLNSVCCSETVSKLDEQVGGEGGDSCDFSEPNSPALLSFQDEEISESPPPSPLVVPNIDEVTFPCKFCKEPPFLIEDRLKDHLKAEHLQICWKCPKCGEVMISSKQLSEHFKDKHKKPSEENSSLPTTQKAASATVTQKIKEDKFEEKGGAGEEESGKVDFFCLKCPWQPKKSLKIIKVFKSWRELHSHVKLKHRKFYWPCKHCYLLKYSQQSLNVHQLLCRKKPIGKI